MRILSIQRHTVRDRSLGNEGTTGYEPKHVLASRKITLRNQILNGLLAVTYMVIHIVVVVSWDIDVLLVSSPRPTTTIDCDSTIMSFVSRLHSHEEKQKKRYSTLNECLGSVSKYLDTPERLGHVYDQ